MVELPKDKQDAIDALQRRIASLKSRIAQRERLSAAYDEMKENYPALADALYEAKIMVERKLEQLRDQLADARQDLEDLLLIEIIAQA